MPLTTQEIKRFIDDDAMSEKKRLAKIGQKYYEGRHDILNYRLFYYNDDGKLTEDTTRANVKISHPFFTELSDQLSAYMLSFTENPIRAKDNVEGLQDHLDTYFDDEFWAEIGDLITGTYNKGFEYLYAFKGIDDRLVFQCSDAMGVVEVREQDTDDHCKYVIYHYIDRIEKGKKTIKKIQVWSEKDVTYYVQSGNTGKIELDKSMEVNPRPHVVFKDRKTGKRMAYGLGYIPFFRLDNNQKKINGLMPIKALIDDYDIHACALSNNLTDFDTPLYVVSGYGGTDLSELQQNLKTKKIVGVDEGGDINARVVDIPYEARKTKLEIDEANIYKFGMGLNTDGLKDTNATTNVVIKSAYSRLKMKADKLEKRLRKVLKQICKVVLAEINATYKKDYQLSDIKITFDRETMVNESEHIENEKIKAETQQIIINNILNVAIQIGDEQALKSICDCLELDYDEIKSKIDKEKAEEDAKGLNGAQATLDGVVVDDE